MSEWWQQSEQQPTPPSEGQPTPPTEPAEPVTPAEGTEGTPAPSEPVTPPAPPTPTPPPVGGEWQRPSAYTPPHNPYQWNASQPQWPQSAPPQPPQKPKRNGVLIALVAILGAVCVCCLGVIAVLLVDGGIDLSPLPSGSNSATSSNTSRDPNLSGPSVSIVDTEVSDGGLSTAQIVADNLDSTVVINLYSKVTGGYGGFIIGEDSEEPVGYASGIVMSADGYIITNEHVVIDDQTGKPYDRIEVEMYNGTLYDAEVIGSDSDTDLAVIKIDANDLKAATFGNSEQVHLGDRVVTIGNSGGLPWSVSQGIVSGLHRDVYDETGYSIQCLQIDATINPGNSGGPLFNCMGQVIGINSAKIVYDGYENLGFSIPINEAKLVIDDLVRYGYVTGRIALGITGYDVTEDGYEGFMIESIGEGSSLQGKGVLKNDIITHIDGVRVTGRTELRSELSKHQAGDTVELTLLRITNNRTGATTTFKVTITLQEAQG